MDRNALFLVSWQRERARVCVKLLPPKIVIINFLSVFSVFCTSKKKTFLSFLRPLSSDGPPTRHQRLERRAPHLRARARAVFRGRRRRRSFFSSSSFGARLRRVEQRAAEGPRRREGPQQGPLPPREEERSSALLFSLFSSCFSRPPRQQRRREPAPQGQGREQQRRRRQ